MTISVDKLMNEMPRLLEQLKKKRLLSLEKLSDIPYDKGVYVFYEKKTIMYVGRSNSLRERPNKHVKSKDYVGFAGKLRKDMSDRKDSRDPKRRISEMQLRVIKISDQKKQALFEIYAALALHSKYNDFSTH